MNITRLVITTSMLVGLTYCSASSDSESDSSDESIGSLQTEDGEDTSGLELVTNDIDKVQENLLPGSLVIDTEELNLLNPCAEAAGFFDCQPRLLKLYLAIAKQVVRQSGFMLAQEKDNINKFKANTKDTFLPPAGDVVKIDYDVTSVKDFTVLLHTAEGPFAFLDADLTGEQRQYRVRFDGRNAPASTDTALLEEDGEEPGVIDATIEYTDDSNFSVTLRNDEPTCDDSDVRAPRRIFINVTMADGVWTGKSMIYSPRWLFNDGEVTCATEPTDAMNMFIYTDWIGNNTNTTAALYMLPASVSEVDDIANWPASAFCSNFNACQNGRGFGDPNPVTTYSNPFCVTADSATTDWGNACSDLGADQFSATANWVVPSEVKALDISAPASL